MGDKSGWVCLGIQQHFTSGRLCLLAANIAVKCRIQPVLSQGFRWTGINFYLILTLHFCLILVLNCAVPYFKQCYLFSKLTA